jgi:predicted lipoprotein with Yx(FWY)xxD motif
MGDLTMRRLLAGSAVLLSVTLLMAACGDDDDDTTSVAPPAAATTGEAATAATATTAAAAAGGATTTGAASGGYDYGGGSATETTAASDGSASASATTAAASATTAAAADEESSGQLALADSSAGKVLVDGEGRTLYLFTPDAQAKPTCNDSCEQTWPYAEPAAGVGAGLDASKLGTTTRADGDAQATYNGWPLYRFAGDAKAGDVNGIGIGGNWFALDGAGDQVDK